jgi:putative adenylate-forming enzyme
MIWFNALLALLRAMILAQSPLLLDLAARRRSGYASQKIVGAEDYRTHFATWNSLGIDLAQARNLARRDAAGEGTGYSHLSFGMSTGTLGEPGVFITTPQDRARWLGTFFARALPANLFFFGSAAVLLRHDNQLYHQTQGRTSFLSLTRGLQDVADSLVSLRPEILVGPPFALRRIVECEAFRRNAWMPKLVITGGEPLWPEDETVLTTALCAPVRQVYQAAEGFFGASCRYGRLHLNIDVMRIERLRFRGSTERFVPVVTDLVREGPQRIVRYRTDDIAFESKGVCPCGSALPAIDGIEGRLADVLVLPTGDLMFPRDVHAALAPELSGSPFRVIQEAAGKLIIELPQQISPVIARHAADRLHARTFCNVEVQQLVMGRLDEKFRRVIRRIPIEKDFFSRNFQEPISLVTSARKAS